MYAQLILITILADRSYYQIHFADEETKALNFTRIELIYSRARV